MASFALVGAESILALTPIAIKKTPVDHVTALWSRILTAGVIGYAVSNDKEIKSSEYGAYSLLGYVNLLHVSTSYESFRHLTAGQAQSILYTYPLWILLLNAKFNQDKIELAEYGYIGLATLGSFLLNFDPGDAVQAISDDTKPNSGWGILMAVIASLTEATMHVILRYLGWRDAGKSVWVVGGFASIWLLLALGVYSMFSGLSYPKIQGSLQDAGFLTGFHGLSTFAGYYLRFFAVPRLSTVTYAILSYSGLIASYIYGIAFLGEKPGFISMVGSLLILISGVILSLPKRS